MNIFLYKPYIFLEKIGRRLRRPGISIWPICSIRGRRGTRLLVASDKLHLGCGMSPIDGFINVDAVKLPGVDLKCGLHKLLDYFPPESISEIYICHTLEHISWLEIPLYLEQFKTLLKPGGILRISVPDISKLMDISKRDNLSFKNIKLLQGILGGGQEHYYNFHKAFFWPDLLQRLLADEGFSEIREYPITPHFAGDTVTDGSLGGFDRSTRFKRTANNGLFSFLKVFSATLIFSSISVIDS